MPQSLAQQVQKPFLYVVNMDKRESTQNVLTSKGTPMTSNEANTINQVQTTQAVMKEHQRTMQDDIDELKKIARDTNAQISELNKKFDELSGAKRAMMWLTGVVLTISGLVIAWLNSHKS